MMSLETQATALAKMKSLCPGQGRVVSGSLQFLPAKEATTEQVESVTSFIASFDPVAEEAKAAKVAMYRETAILKLAKVEAEAAGDAEAAKTLGDQATAAAGKAP